MDQIHVIGARQNNLAGVTTSIPKDAITVFTGVSGSGKSSLAFGTIAAESQRQLNETFDSFARHRLPRHGRPDVERLENLSVAIVVDQRPFGGDARSTVGTATDVAALLRLLFSRTGEPHAGESTAFSFNDPRGMCPECDGIGTVERIDVEQLLDRSRSLDDGAIRFPTFAPGTWRWKRYVHSGLFDRGKPLGEWSAEELRLLLDAPPHRLRDPPPEWPKSGTYENLLDRFARAHLTGANAKVHPRHRAELERVVHGGPCPACGGARLNAAALASRIDGRSIADWSALEVRELLPVAEAVRAPAVAPVVAALTERLRELERIGLGYLSLDRVSSTLSGGEAQRVKLVRHLGSSLTGLTYVLDEPSSGLHARDVHLLATTLRGLRDKGNTVLLVEHDRDLIEIADHVVDLGPGAGAAGGRVVYEGALDGLLRAGTATARHLRGRTELRRRPRRPTGEIAIERASANNLRDVTVTIPTGVLTVVSGVAGAGKSTLVERELPRVRPDVALLDQRPIRGGRRSSPATLLNVLDRVRALFARANGVSPAWFSPNSKGACPACGGSGEVATDLAFMEPVATVCERCDGRRFNPRALGWRYRGRAIDELLAMTASEAAELFEDDPQIADALARLETVGLGHLALGRRLDTLSGGERQRLKLARELAQPSELYVFDEPTTGLHGSDVATLLALLHRLVDDGATVVVVEHDLDVIADADWVIDVGPGAGSGGGRVVCEGPPQRLLEVPESVTGRCLAQRLSG